MVYFIIFVPGNILDDESQENRQKQAHHAGEQYIQFFLGSEGRTTALGGVQDLDVLHIVLFEFQVFYFFSNK